MRIYLGGHLNFYHPQKDRWLEVDLENPRSLKLILAEYGIPTAEITLDVVNDVIKELNMLLVAQEDIVRIFPPVGGG